MNEKTVVLDTQSYPSVNSQLVLLPYNLQPVIQVGTLPAQNINCIKRTTGNRRLIPKGPLTPLVSCIKKKKPVRGKERKVSEKYNQENNITLTNTMLPDMPSLGNAPLMNDNSQTDSTKAKENANEATTKESPSFKNIASYFQSYNPNSVNQVRKNFENISEFCKNTTEKNSSQSDISPSTVINSSEKDNPDDINELMKASSTVKNITKKKPSGAEKKRAKVRREFVCNLAMATPDTLETQNRKEENFADAFFDKLRQKLTAEDYDKLVDILGHYDETHGDFLELFKNVQTILFPKYVELAEEFYLFLTDIQAHKVGQLMPYFLMKDMDRFIKKLHIYFQDQPAQMKKIIKTITELSEDPDITMEAIKTAIIPLFKGNVALTDWFLQIFPCERPPKLLTTGPHEGIDISKELARPPGEDICETVTFPDTDDPYGGPNCICSCHNVENVQFKSRSQHCKQCGLKFIQGKIYIQTGKGFRPAVVSFLTNSEKDHSKRLAATERKRSEISPNKQVTSPYKENHHHDENSNESEDDESKKKNPKQAKTKRKRKVKDPDKPIVKAPKKTLKSCEKTKSENSKRVKSLPKRPSKKRIITKKSAELKPNSTIGQQKQPAEEQETECSESLEHVELKVSSDHSAESGGVVEFFESSQDVTNTDTEDSNDPASVQSTKQSASWTREEDKTILQAFRQSSDNEETFKQISKVLQNRSVAEIKSRFHKLMSLLQEMAANSNS